jgi:hypothetical protein
MRVWKGGNRKPWSCLAALAWHPSRALTVTDLRQRLRLLPLRARDVLEESPGSHAEDKNKHLHR